MGWGALEGSPLLAFTASAEGVVVRANRAATDRWRAGMDAITGFPADAREQIAAAAAAATAGNTTSFEWGERGPGGIRCWYVATVSPLGEDDGGLYLCVSTDVSTLKRSEERLRLSEQLMVDTQGVAHLGTWDWDITQPHATWSEELYRIYDLHPETYTPSYEAYLTKVHPEDRQRVIDATNAVFHHHVPYSHDERIYRPDGSIRYLHTWARPILDDRGGLVRLVGVCQDVTDRKLVEEELRVLNLELEHRVAERTRLLEQSLRDLEAFNAMVSHDLRAPLTVIHLSASMIDTLLPESGTSEKIAECLGRIQSAVTGMTALVDDLLTLARVGQLPLRRAEVDLSNLARDVLDELARTDARRTVAIEVEPAIRCVADPQLIRMAMQNLLGNAWKYTSLVAQPRIEIGTTVADGKRTVFVRDNGAGFDMTQAHRLFLPFERLHDSSEFPGTGMGLAAVQRIVERHGGRVWGESDVGRGATFFFDLPHD
jgi:signal transduction histidine kinase